MPAIAVRVPGGRTFALDPSGGLTALRARVEAAQGRPLGNLTLVTLDGRTLHGGGSEVEAGGAVAVAGPATTAAPPLPAPSSSSFRPAIAPPPPPPLTPLSPTITLIIHPRTQTETWSAYWKESMRTLTKACAPFTLAAGRGDAVAGVLAQVGLAAGWPGVEGLERLPGFTDPWEAAFVRGHALSPPGGDWGRLTLAEAGLAGGGDLVVVRRVLVAEKWNLIEASKPGEEGREGEEDTDSDLESTDEEEADPLEGEGRWCGL